MEGRDIGVIIVFRRVDCQESFVAKMTNTMVERHSNANGILHVETFPKQTVRLFCHCCCGRCWLERLLVMPIMMMTMTADFGKGFHQCCLKSGKSQKSTHYGTQMRRKDPSKFDRGEIARSPGRCQIITL